MKAKDPIPLIGQARISPGIGTIDERISIISNIESGVPKMNPDIYGRKIDQIQASENDAGLHTVAEEGLLVRYHCDQGRNLTH
jgi:hypothetical protein